ncbi:hypothetical protein Golob_023967 [Gossypium lobatum]|uniref:Uncharacterized protein n=1 Tax=Gossypium lobatum TaxID=34289 RepID=A0A7J8NF68_9ROSI|nr:hypothetical protein [Gossypium lobatum]
MSEQWVAARIKQKGIANTFLRRT